MTAIENKGVPARTIPDHSATSPRGIAASGPQPSGNTLPPAFRRALAGVPSKDAGAASQLPKGGKGLAGQAKNDKSGGSHQHTPRNVTAAPRSGHK